MEGKREWEKVEVVAVGAVEAAGDVESDILLFGGKREVGEDAGEDVRMSRWG